MGPLIGFPGITLGWWSGARIGVMAAFFCSVVGGEVGLYCARRWARDHLP